MVGSRSSSNSRRLYELATQLGATAYLIDTAADLQKEWLIQGATIGLTAGASAPAILIDEVIAQLRTWGAYSVEEYPGRREEVSFPLPRELQ